jgi:hypothetical protein
VPGGNPALDIHFYVGEFVMSQPTFAAHHAKYDFIVYDDEHRHVGFVSHVWDRWVAYGLDNQPWDDGTSRMNTKVGCGLALIARYEQLLVEDAIVKQASKPRRN